ncbi:hypothetical protein JNUCC1_03350 [Lentibacillus sp. JNUCC-1]|uniref:hypothetical protein n=1 Tax=Lentibacillus sp. JNUCC-1 TaxID=2654513 RepID=UPI0012E89E6B|nr:hypothetical protein [Lentibacillus sp. JNUCC-1]MUV39472.1 hypothetical protein [Lentibacillus sp. JNUCC-1]
MKVKMLVSMASESEVNNVGDVIDVKKSIAVAWKEKGIAEIVEEKKEKKKGDK